MMTLTKVQTELPTLLVQACGSSGQCSELALERKHVQTSGDCEIEFQFAPFQK